MIKENESMNWVEQKQDDARRAREHFADAELTVVTDDEACGVFVYSLRKPGTRLGGVTLVFTLEGMAILGDMACREWHPTQQPGRSRNWFLHRPKGEYLLENFMQARCIQLAAEDEVRDWAESARDDGESGDAARLVQIADWLTTGVEPGWEAELYERLCDLGTCYADDGLPGWTWPSWESSLLEAIVDRFCDLFPGVAKEAA